MFIPNSTNNAANKELKKFTYDVAQKFSEMDFFNKLVEYDDNPNDAASSEASYLFVGPPTLSQASNIASIKEMMMPLGGVQQFSPSESLQHIPVGEIGSKIKRVARGSTNYSLQISRLFTRHSNLKYALYKFLPKIMDTKTVEMSRVPGKSETGYFAGLESELYGVNFGILSVTCTAAGIFIGADYMEKCAIMNYGTAKQARNVIEVNNASLYVSRVIPFIQKGQNTYIGGEDLSAYNSTPTQLVQYTFKENTSGSAASTEGE